ncbi:uncharacterized protein YALI1_D11756g [Yarrowia lipolytica]|uniref:Uncharacterized protein n=1 Tax=Yarrowia lipolytica TaxID=4952 RepID=A0A1D8NDY9_YARLL|nr:hypothetical protein YALI1_D11756g [Yarrowia lipolytica]
MMTVEYLQIGGGVQQHVPVAICNEPEESCAVRIPQSRPSDQADSCPPRRPARLSVQPCNSFRGEHHLDYLFNYSTWLVWQYIQLYVLYMKASIPVPL